MAALTRAWGTPYQDAGLIPVPVAAGVVIFQGGMVVANPDGMAVPGSTATGLRYIGRAEQTVDNRDGGAGALQVVVRRGKAFKWANDGSITQAHLMQTAYIVDDHTVAATDGAGTRSAAGKIVIFEWDGVWVEA